MDHDGDKLVSVSVNEFVAWDFTNGEKFCILGTIFGVILGLALGFTIAYFVFGNNGKNTEPQLPGNLIIVIN